MSTINARKAETKETTPLVSGVPVFTKRNILTFKRYANRRDLLSVLLKDGEEYRPVMNPQRQYPFGLSASYSIYTRPHPDREWH